MSRRWVAWAAGTVLAALLGLLVAATVRPARPAPPESRTLPAVSLPRLDGRGTVDLGTLRGRPTLINFWASWCAECRAEFAALAGVRDRNVRLVGVAFQDSATSARAFVARTGADWLTLHDRDSRAAVAFGVTAIPQTFFVTAQGRISEVRVGALDVPSLAAALDRLTGGGATTRAAETRYPAAARDRLTGGAR